jgi:hypothetical protein
MIPGAETRARLDDRIGVAAVTYLLFGVTLGPGLALSLVLVFAIWIGWRWLCRKTSRGLERAVLARLRLFRGLGESPSDVILKLATEGLTVCAYVPGVYELGRSRIELGRRRIERALL